MISCNERDVQRIRDTWSRLPPADESLQLLQERQKKTPQLHPGYGMCYYDSEHVSKKFLLTEVLDCL